MGTPLIKFPEAFLILDSRNRIIDLNQAGEELLKIMKADVLGKSVDELFARHSIMITDEEVLPALGKEFGLKSGNGFSLSVELKVSSIQGTEDTVRGRILIVRDLELSPQGYLLRNPNAILTAFQETAFDLHSTLDLDAVLNNIVERACKLLGTEHGYLDILRESGELETMVGIGIFAESIKLHVAKGEGVTGTVWKTGKPLVIDNYEKWEGRKNKFLSDDIRAVVGMPLILEGQVVGVIGSVKGVGSETGFSEDDVLVLKRFADLAVVALQNARLFEKAQREIEFRRKTEIKLRNANQLLQFQIERVELLQDRLQELAIRDPLTNLFNRRYLQEMLAVEFARSKRAHTSFAVLMMDSDQLKAINDEYGHKAGDDFLVHIANVIRGSIRAGDIACRYGGDEFVVVLNNVAEEIAFARAEKLRKSIAEHHAWYKNIEVKISVSIGIAMFPAHGSTGEGLLQKADLALYEAKQMGKNRIVVYSGEGG
jgi:diguanylate cyclase (GGDEF)-like protein/PAS domain S-box-containing protein